MADLRSQLQAQAYGLSLRRQARPQAQIAQRDGTGVVVNGQTLRANKVTNEPLGTGEAVVVSGDSAVGQQERRRLDRRRDDPARLSVTGDVKILASVERGSILEYWLGGDRRLPILVVSVLKSEVLSVSFESTGSDKSQWLLALKTSVGVNSARIRLFDSTGAVQDSTDNKNKYLSYKGSGFWASSVLESPPFTYSSTSTGSQSNLGGVVTNFINGSAFGGSISWSYPFTAFDGSQGGVSAVTVNNVVFTIIPPSSGDFDWDQQANKETGQNDTYSWTPTPGVYEGFEYLTGQRICTPPEAAFARVRYGQRNVNESSFSKTNESSKSYFVAFYGNSFYQLSGNNSYAFDKSSSKATVGYFGSDQVFPVSCVEGPGPLPGQFIGNYVISDPIITPPPTPSPAVVSASEVESRAKTQLVYVAPGITKINSFQYDKNGATTTTVSTSYQSVLSFDLTNSYVYQLSASSGTKTFQNSRGVEIEVFGFDPTSASVIQSDDKTQIYKVDNASLQSGEWKRKAAKIQVSIKELTGQNYSDAESVSRKILPILPSFVGVDETKVKLIAARAWI